MLPLTWASAGSETCAEHRRMARGRCLDWPVGRWLTAVASHHPTPGEADPAPTADDQMVEDLDAEQFTGTHQPSGDRLVVARRLRIAAGVVVRQHDRRGVGQQRVAEHLPRTHEG